MHANKSVYMQIKTCATCKNWDVGSFTLCGKFKTSGLAAKCMFEGHSYWESKQEKTDDYFIKDCKSCKYDHNGWCNKFQRYCAIASSPKCLGGSGDCISHRYWKPKQASEEKALSQAIELHLETIAARKSWTFEERENKKEMPKFSKIPDNVFAAICGEPYKPPEPPLELSDLYNLAFPFDPIQEYFAGIYKQINDECEKQEQLYDSVKAKPVKRVKPVEMLDKPKSKNENLEIFVSVEKILALCDLIAYAIAIVLCVLCGEWLIETTAFCIGLFFVMTAVNAIATFAIATFFEGRHNT